MINEKQFMWAARGGQVFTFRSRHDESVERRDGLEMAFACSWSAVEIGILLEGVDWRGSERRFGSERVAYEFLRRATKYADLSSALPPRSWR